VSRRSTASRRAASGEDAGGVAAIVAAVGFVIEVVAVVVEFVIVVILVEVVGDGGRGVGAVGCGCHGSRLVADESEH